MIRRDFFGHDLLEGVPGTAKTLLANAFARALGIARTSVDRVIESGSAEVPALKRDASFDADERVYRPAAEMLRQLDIQQIRLLTNNPLKVEALAACGVEVVARVPHSFPANGHNAAYLDTKAQRFGHLL